MYECVGAVSATELHALQGDYLPIAQQAFSKSSFMLKTTWTAAFPWFPWGNRIAQMQIVGLLPSQQIVRHQDQSIAPLVRYHLPLQTNDGCWSFAGGAWTQLQLGGIYRLDPTEPHGAVNWGADLRVHLMIDCEA